MIAVASPGAQYRAHGREIDAAIERVLRSGSYILGDEVEAFERAFADYCGCSYAVGVGSGTDALLLSLKALGVSAGDEVITVSHTAVATVAAIVAAGAVPVLVDIDPKYYTLDVAMLDGATTDKTRAIIPVHLYGQPARMDAICDFAKGRGLAVVEDGAQATGGILAAARIGSFGDVGCFSFYPTKNLGGIGDGGIVVTNNENMAHKVRQLRQYGWGADRRPHCSGLNSRLDSLQAAILSAKLPNLDRDNTRRIELARRYSRGLREIPVLVPKIRPDARHVFHLYVIQCEERDALRSSLAAEDIETSIHYPVPVHQQPTYGELARVEGTLDETSRLVGKILTLPLYPELKEEEVDYVIERIHNFYRGRLRN